MKLNIQLFGGRGASSTATQHIGFGDYSKDNIPVYKGKIDYTGNFSFANVSKMSNKQLQEALKVQQQKLQEAYARPMGDQRTKNGRLDKVFRQAQINIYEKGVENIDKEIEKRKRK